MNKFVLTESMVEFKANTKNRVIRNKIFSQKSPVTSYSDKNPTHLFFIFHRIYSIFITYLFTIPIRFENVQIYRFI